MTEMQLVVVIVQIATCAKLRSGDMPGQFGGVCDAGLNMVGKSADVVQMYSKLDRNEVHKFRVLV